MNVEIGAEAAQFPEKEYINGIAFAVHPLAWGERGWESPNSDEGTCMAQWCSTIFIYIRTL
jgi:hypothetical protein